MGLHDRIMNVQVRYSRGEFLNENEYLRYKEGHGDARHDAAELSLISDELLEALEACLSDLESESMPSDESFALMEKARTAIAKAKGVEQ